MLSHCTEYPPLSDPATHVLIQPELWWPPATSHQLPASSPQPPATCSHRSAATSHQLPAINCQLPSTSSPATSRQPPASSCHPAAPSRQPKVRSAHPMLRTHPRISYALDLATCVVSPDPLHTRLAPRPRLKRHRVSATSMHAGEAPSHK